MGTIYYMYYLFKLIACLVEQKKTIYAICNTIGYRENKKHHYNDCYFCNVNLNGFSNKNKHIVYFYSESTIKAVLYSDLLFISNL